MKRGGDSIIIHIKCKIPKSKKLLGYCFLTYNVSLFRWLDHNFNLYKNPYLNRMDEYKPRLPDSLLIQKPASLDDLKFVFYQVEKRVKETADDGDKLNSKSLTIIGICLTFIAALVGYLATRDWKWDNSPAFIVSGYMILTLIQVCKILKDNIYPVKYRSLGSYPSALLADEMFNNLEKGETAEYRMVYNEILAYEERVMLNTHHNDNRNDRVRRAYDKLYEIPWYSILLLGSSFLFLCLFRLAAS